MTRKSLGYVELEWTCKRCGTVNPGLQKTCTSCGSPLAENDQFELPEEQKLITDEAKLEAAKKGPDIHCPYCGTANPAGSPSCKQCSGDLSEGALRAAGKVLGAHQEGPAAQIACPYCSTMISPNVQRCPNCGGDLAPKEAKPAPAAVERPGMPKWMMLVGVALLVLCVGAAAVFFILSMRTEDVRAYVQNVAWQRSIEVLETRLVEQNDWENELPNEAQNVSCSDQYRQTSSVPVPNATEVCGTPYTVDTGSGVGEVIQDCEYLVYDSFCSYEAYQWVVVTQEVTQGSDLQPYWPDLALSSIQREGNRQEQYRVIFVADGETYTYDLTDPNAFTQFTPGSEWTLKVNALGGLSAVEP